MIYIANGTDFLMHYGVPGMRWGVRKAGPMAQQGLRLLGGIRGGAFIKGHKSVASISKHGKDFFIKGGPYGRHVGFSPKIERIRSIDIRAMNKHVDKLPISLKPKPVSKSRKIVNKMRDFGGTRAGKVVGKTLKFAGEHPYATVAAATAVGTGVNAGVQYIKSRRNQKKRGKKR